jgi:hypothetical protein
VNNYDLPFQFVDDPASWREADALIARIPRAARGKQKLFGVLAEALKFPRYFGWNWDALEECLRDLSWLRETKQIAIVHTALPLSPRGQQLSIYLSVLTGTIKLRGDTPPKLQVVFPTTSRESIEAALPCSG